MFGECQHEGKLGLLTSGQFVDALLRIDRELRQAVSSEFQIPRLIQLPSNFEHVGDAQSSKQRMVLGDGIRSLAVLNLLSGWDRIRTHAPFPPTVD